MLGPQVPERRRLLSSPQRSEMPSSMPLACACVRCRLRRNASRQSFQSGRRWEGRQNWGKNTRTTKRAGCYLLFVLPVFRLNALDFTTMILARTVAVIVVAVTLLCGVLIYAVNRLNHS